MLVNENKENAHPHTDRMIERQNITVKRDRCKVTEKIQIDLVSNLPLFLKAYRVGCHKMIGSKF